MIVMYVYMQSFIFCLLITAASYNCKRRKAVTYHLSTEACIPVKVKVAIENEGCEKKIFITYGCKGQCRSETSISPSYDHFVPNCNCCQPRSTKRAYIPIKCDNREIKFAEVITAKECYCSPCKKRPHLG